MANLLSRVNSMTQVIEIVVVGPVGSGKSHVLELIDKALRESYGPHAQVVSRELSEERALNSPSAKPDLARTIFNLRERGEASSRTIEEMRVSIDTSVVTSALSKIEAIQGEAMAFTFDRLESAIDTTARVMREERESAIATHGLLEGGPTLVYQRLNQHLDSLLAAQLKRISNDE
jgi:ABC-type phosphate/phosphonate transport system ATPase subunit